MSRTAYFRQNRDRRRSDGRCVECGTGKPKEGRTHCQGCLQAKRRYLKAARELKVSMGICAFCNERLNRYFYLCDGHQERMLARQRERRAKKRVGAAVNV